MRLKKLTTILAVFGIAGAALAVDPPQQDNSQPPENQLQQQVRPPRPEGPYTREYWRNIARRPAEKAGCTRFRSVRRT